MLWQGPTEIESVHTIIGPPVFLRPIHFRVILLLLGPVRAKKYGRKSEKTKFVAKLMSKRVSFRVVHIL